MRKALSKTDALKKIESYFKEGKLEREQTRKIKRLAMKYRIRLGKYRARFCKKCYADLKSGRVRVTKTHKSISCSECGFLNKSRIT